MKHTHLLIPLLVGLVTITACADAQDSTVRDSEGAIRFTSVPDIFNWNIGNPQPGWDKTLDWYFERLKKEGPDFTLIAGDIMDARWYEPELIEKKTAEYWGGFLERFKDHEITVYVAPGDHEYGDDKGLTMGDVSRRFGKQFTELMGMPRNGPKNHLGRAFFVRKGNLLVISLDTFEDAGRHFAYAVGDEQLAWMKKVLTDHEDAEFVIVQGHLPIVGPVRSKNSSANMMRGGTNSKLWKLMVDHGVDAYLCGEHHRITVHRRDGIWQIVHGALWGAQTDLNYMRGIVEAGKLRLELLEFDVAYSGGYIGDHPHRDATNRPRENVELAESTRTKGPRVTGSLTIETQPDGSKKSTVTEGWFSKERQGR